MRPSSRDEEIRARESRLINRSRGYAACNTGESVDLL